MQIMTKSFKDDFMIENEKATQALLFHENLIDVIQPEHYPFYNTILKNLCIGDYFDRISFQKQLWIFNEMTYYIKLLHNYYLYQESNIIPKRVSVYRFTKVINKSWCKGIINIIYRFFIRRFICFNIIK
jgi:hypothetical protein